MDEVGPTASMIIAICLLVIDFLFFGFGEALKGVNSKEIERKAEENGDKKSRRLTKILDRPSIFVNTLQMTVTLLNFLVGAVFADNLLYLAIIFYVILSFGILMPKKLAARKPEKWAYRCLVPVYYIMMLLWPFTWLVAATVKALLWIFGIRKDVNLDDVTEEEIISMVNEGQEQGVLQASEAEMINNIIELDDKEAQDIMTHRNNIVAIDGQMLLSEALQFMLHSHNSRYPVYEENIDHIIGVIHLKDAMRLQSGEDFVDKPVCETVGAMREANFIPSTRNINELFKQMQSEKLQMVIVVDEYGQTDGLIAMEDILEEIVGNIMDEYDEVTEYIEEKSEDEYVIEGKTPLEELEEKLDISFDEEEFETINGFLISKLERIPQEGEEFDVDYKGYNFKILKVEHKMVQSVLVTRLPETDVEDMQTELEE
ncbi:MAG: HlyC/CorC family transporter [Lachnospiraceae bacterium]|nr:HlyC/CorC family transporter [Lachnospiraceae bacterium]